MTREIDKQLRIKQINDEISDINEHISECISKKAGLMIEKKNIELSMIRKRDEECQ